MQRGGGVLQGFIEAFFCAVESGEDVFEWGGGGYFCVHCFERGVQAYIGRQFGTDDSAN